VSPLPRPPGLRLNVGCGRSILAGWVNLDRADLPGVDIVADLEACGTTPLPLANDSVAELLLSHVLEHVRDTLGLMAELHRVAKPGALLTVRVPHGGSDDAWEDPTHDRAYFPGSFGYFSQPYYWRADYGYRGDWQTEQVVLYVPAAEHAGQSIEVLHARIARERNLVLEMVATLRSVKPIREPRRELIVPPAVVILPG
jgi:SAM-dependent methyltransferase